CGLSARCECSDTDRYTVDPAHRAPDIALRPAGEPKAPKWSWLRPQPSASSGFSWGFFPAEMTLTANAGDTFRLIRKRINRQKVPRNAQRRKVCTGPDQTTSSAFNQRESG